MQQEENNKVGFNSLKTIHSLQSNGTLQEILRDLKATKNQLEDFQRKVFQRSLVIKETEQAKHVEEEQQKNVSPVIEHTEIKEKVEIDTPKVEEKVQTESVNYHENNTQTKENVNQRSFNNQRPQYRNDNNTNQQRPYNNNYQGQRPYNNNYQGQRPYTPRPQGQNGYQGQNNYQGQRPYAPRPQGQGGYQGQRPYQQRPQGQGGYQGQRPYAPRTASTSFVPTKQNNFKNFSAPTETIEAPTIRNFGNKNKSKQVEEKKTMSKKSLIRRNIIISDNEGFDDERMGSRKLVKSKRKEQPVFVDNEIKNAVITSNNVTVKSLSEKTGKSVNELIKKLMILGVMANINSSIDFATAELICSELGVTLEQKIDKTYEQKLKDIVVDEDKESLTKRPPVVTVMGHVDHGKTSLLDYIRKTNVVGGEAGGITQRIGAYQIVANGEKITFIDTPGHAAFTQMRARGAKVTDMAILVVAADDGIMPQTIEAINHIKAANVPMLVAINKIDKPEANIEKCKQQLAENGVLPEEWGGDAIVVPVSAKTGVGIDNLISMILLVAEMQNLTANPQTAGFGTVIEAELDKNRGPVASILVQNGTLKLGDNVVAGVTYGKIKAMFDENGKVLKVAGPSTPVVVLGFNDVPSSGDQIFAVNEKFSKQVIEERINKIKLERAQTTSGVSLDDFMDKVNEGKLKNLNIIIKADVQGSVEALRETLIAIRNDEVKVVCIHSGAGPVTESDLVLAQASNAVIINFNLKTPARVQSLADSMKVEIKNYKVIYETVDDITNAIKGLMTVKYEEKIIGHAEVRMVFKLSSSGVVAGSYITDGKAARNAGVRIIRNNETILTTAIESLKIQKDDKAEVNYGYECGVKLKDSSDVKEGDTLEIFQNIPIER